MPTPISKPMATPGTQGPPSAVQKGGCRPLFTASPSVSNTPLSDVGNTPRSQSSAMHSFRQARHDMECKIQDMTLIIGDLKKKLKEVTAELGQTKLANQAATSEIVQQRATIAKLQCAVAAREASNETLSKVAGKSAYNGGEARKWRLQAHDLQAQTLGVVLYCCLRRKRRRPKRLRRPKLLVQGKPKGLRRQRLHLVSSTWPLGFARKSCRCAPS